MRPITKSLRNTSNQFPLTYSLLLSIASIPLLPSDARVNWENVNHTRNIIPGIRKSRNPPVTTKPRIEKSHIKDQAFFHPLARASFIPIVLSETAYVNAAVHQNMAINPGIEPVRSPPATKASLASGKNMDTMRPIPVKITNGISRNRAERRYKEISIMKRTLKSSQDSLKSSAIGLRPLSSCTGDLPSGAVCRIPGFSSSFFIPLNFSRLLLIFSSFHLSYSSRFLNPGIYLLKDFHLSLQSNLCHLSAAESRVIPTHSKFFSVTCTTAPREPSGL